MAIAHRGASGTRPENTMAAFREALALGIRCLECDVRLSRDGCIVVIHDVKVDRTTDGSGRVADLDVALLRALDAGAWFDPRFRGERIPLLEEVLAILPEDGRLVVEIKEDDRSPRLTDAVLSLLETVQGRGRVGISAFEWPTLRRVRERSSSVEVSALLRAPAGGAWDEAALTELLAEASRVGANILCPNASTITGELVNRLHAAGYPVRAWGLKGRDEPEMARLIACGADGMTTDYPEVLAEFHRRLGA